MIEIKEEKNSILLSTQTNQSTIKEVDALFDEEKTQINIESSQTIKTTPNSSINRICTSKQLLFISK